jgi:predicted nucleic acid-binding protein
MSLGDALIAATAIVHRLTLVTHNVTDFDWIDGLIVLDPLAK